MTIADDATWRSVSGEDSDFIVLRPLKNIVQVVQADDSVEMKPVTVELSERELRILRFSLDRALESL